MGDEFGSRPRFGNGFGSPLVGGYSIGGAEEGALGFSKPVLNAVELLHSPHCTMSGKGARRQFATSGKGRGKRIATKRKSLECSGASLLEGMRQLKHLGFAKGRAKDLKADGEGSSDAAAGHGNARQAR